MSEGVPPHSPGRLSDRKRASILEAAVEEFASGGFDNTSMDRIAERAGVSKRTVYNHFQSKDALFHAIVEEMVEQVDALPEIRYDPGRELSEQLIECMSRVAELMASESLQGLARVSVSRFLMSPELARETLGDEKRFIVRLIRWIEEARADGKLKVPDAEFAAKQLSALLEGFALWPQLFGFAGALGPEQRKSIVESSVAMFLAYYRA